MIELLTLVAGLMAYDGPLEMPTIRQAPPSAREAGQIAGAYFPPLNLIVVPVNAPMDVLAHELCHHVQKLRGDDCTGTRWIACEVECANLQKAVDRVSFSMRG